MKKNSKSQQSKRQQRKSQQAKSGGLKPGALNRARGVPEAADAMSESLYYRHARAERNPILPVSFASNKCGERRHRFHEGRR